MAPHAAGAARRTFIVVVCVAFLLAGARPARAASPAPQWQAGQFELTVWPSPGPIYLCVGESIEGGARVYAYPIPRIEARQSFTDRSTLNATLTNPIGRLNVFPGTVFSGAAANLAWRFTASQLGDTRLTFDAQVNVDNRSYVVRSRSVDVTVTCAFKLNVVSQWVLPGEREHVSISTIMDVIMAPDRATGLYHTDATSENGTHAQGACTGGASVADSQAHFDGQLVSSQPPEIHVQVTYDRAAANSWEGCIGKSRSGWGQPDPLSFTVNYGRLTYGPYTISLPQNLQTDGGTMPGRATITVEP